MKLVLTVAVLIACASVAPAQNDYWLKTVRNDFREASVVVRMNVLDTKLTENKDEYAYGFIASGIVTASFKGKFKPGQRLEFYVRAEHGYIHTTMRGDKIAFLTSFVNRKDGPFQELPDGNTVTPYSKDLLTRVRKVWRESQRVKNRK